MIISQIIAAFLKFVISPPGICLGLYSQRTGYINPSRQIFPSIPLPAL
jgi:hypothetical protein